MFRSPCGQPRSVQNAAEMLDEPSDFLIGQLITEGRHHRIEAAHTAALMDDRIPIEIGLRSRQTDSR